MHNSFVRDSIPKTADRAGQKAIRDLPGKEKASPMILETERLVLREMTPEDEPALYAVLGDSGIMQHYPYAFDGRRVRGWIEKNRTRYRENGFGLWAVCLKHTGEMIGDCGLTLQQIQGETLPEIGYHIRRDCQRKGYAREAAAAVRDWAFEHTVYPTLYSCCKYTNVPSFKTAEAIGMRFMKEYPDETNGVTHVSGISREAWENIRKAEEKGITMTESAREDYQKLLDHWDSAFAMTAEDREQDRREAEGEEGWRELAPSEKLFLAARSMKDCENVLDFGSGSGWAGIIMAKCGCKRVTCADPAPNAREMAAHYAARFRVEERLHPICISDTWLAQVPDGTYDGFFCSNVLDVIPPEMAEEILCHAERIVRKDGRAVIGLNFCMPPERMEQRGMSFTDGNKVYVNGVLRLVSRTDEEWAAVLEKHFAIDRLEHFAWPGEETETRRLFFLRPRNHPASRQKS